jgi:hypothetical protein
VIRVRGKRTSDVVTLMALLRCQRHVGLMQGNINTYSTTPFRDFDGVGWLFIYTKLHA